MTRKRLIWILIAALIVAWGINKNNQDDKKEAIQTKLEEKLAEELAAATKKRLDNVVYGIYLSSTCEFKNALQPVTEVLQNISERKAIPPDLISEMEIFNESARYISSDQRLLKDSSVSPTPEEIQTEQSLKKFAEEVNLRTAELKQGMISASNPYFSNLESRIENIVQPVCALAERVNPSKKSSPSPIPSASESKTPGSVDSILEKIGKQVSYDAVCKLYASSKSLIEDAINAQTSQAFKPAVLESSKKVIDDLGYASFSFRKGSFYKQSAEELTFSSRFDDLKSKMENNRYNFWANSSKSTLRSINDLSREIGATGELGCEVAEGLKKK